jgi:hypothetical protein
MVALATSCAPLDDASDPSGTGEMANDLAAGAYVPTPHAHEYRSASGTPLARLDAVIAAAANDRHFMQPASSGAASGKGPNALQGVAHIAFDPSSPPFAGANLISLSGPVTFRSNVRLEIDSGVGLVYGWSADGAMFEWNGVDNVTITRGDPSHGTGRRAGRYWIDLSHGARASVQHAIVMENTSNWLIEYLHTTQQQQTNGASVIARSTAGHVTPSQSPRLGIYRHHSNDGSPTGYGPNQLVSLSDTYIYDLWTDGGTTLRFETDGNASGVHRVVADQVYCQNGDRALALTPHAADSDHITVTNVRAVSCFAGVVTGDDNFGSQQGGVFTSTTVTNGCVVAGNDAQLRVPPGQFPDPGPRGRSLTVIEWSAASRSSIDISNIGYAQPVPFSGGVGGHGASASVQCSATIAEANPPG